MSSPHPSGSTQMPESVDVVVVGGGAAGCVVAARLSEDPTCTVLLLEAGPPVDGELISVPGDALSLVKTPLVTFTPVPGDPGTDRPVPYQIPTGRVLGGGSSVNDMAWFQGHPDDYDGWAAARLPGWGWDDVLPVFRRIEDYVLGASPHHGNAGPMTITRTAHFNDVYRDFFAAAEQAGIRVLDDVNGTERCGVGLVHSNIRDGRRHSVVNGYLDPALGRPNLTVRTGVAVEKVTFSGRRATGVTWAGGQVRARQVVLTAGALRTPQLLMLSGVGPAEHLRKVGVDVVHDLPGVGENLHDHVGITPTWPLDRTLHEHGAGARLAYRLVRRGPLASSSVAVGMLPLPGSTAPDIQIFFFDVPLGPDLQPRPFPGTSATTALLTPRSRGRVRLHSAHPLDPPVADPNYLDDPTDLPRLREGVKLASTIFAAPALRDITGPRVVPAPDATDDEIDDFVRQQSVSFAHPVGTARMGTDPQAVVDAGLAVHGMSGLYVSDASVMPTITRGNTQAPTILIAERGADLIAASRKR